MVAKNQTNHPNNIRNVTYLSAFNHGSTTLLNAMLSKFGINKSSDEGYTEMTIKSSPISIIHESKNENKQDDNQYI